MEIKSISASRIKTYDHCKFKYIMNYQLKQCKQCHETFYTPEMFEDGCPHCGSKEFGPPDMRSNWGAVHGTALHTIMEQYAIAIRGTDEDGNEITPAQKKEWLNWKKALKLAYKRGTDNGQSKEDFAIYDIAKPKDVEASKKWCEHCHIGKPCKITGELLDHMQEKGCQGCPNGLYDESVALLTKYVKRYDPLLKQRKILGVEKFFDLDFGINEETGNQMKSIGYIDLVTELDEDTIEIIDHKFGSWVPSFDEFSNDIQVKMYSMAARKLFPDYKEYIITFDYIRKNPLSMAFTPEEDEETKQWIINKWKQIERPQVVTRTMVQGNGIDPDSSWKCRSMCDSCLCKKEWPKFKEKFGGN